MPMQNATDDDEIKEMKKEIEKEMKEHEADGTPYGPMMPGQDGEQQDGQQPGQPGQAAAPKPKPIDPMDKPINDKVSKFKLV